MKSLRTVVYLIGYFLLFSSCTPEPIDIDVSQAPEKIVVASQLVEDNVLVVVLSKSFSALNPKQMNVKDTAQPLPVELLVKGAEVILQTPQGNVIMEEINDGVYVAINLPIYHYMQYTLKVNDKILQQRLTANASLLPKTYLDTFGITGLGNNEYWLHYAFKDNSQEENWYVVNFYTKDHARDSAGSKPSDIDYITKRLMEQRLDFDLISDKDMVNGTYSITKKFKSNNLDTFAIALSNISKGYFEFLSAQKKYASITNKIRGEIINMPTNINNGYGFWSLSSPDAKAIQLNN
jgi:hypothetical protein